LSDWSEQGDAGEDGKRWIASIDSVSELGVVKGEARAEFYWDEFAVGGEEFGVDGDWGWGLGFFRTLSGLVGGGVFAGVGGDFTENDPAAESDNEDAEDDDWDFCVARFFCWCWFL